jgi:hypothetical protein
MKYVWTYIIAVSILLVMMATGYAADQKTSGSYHTCRYPYVWAKVGDHYDYRENPDQTVYEWPRCSSDDTITIIKK